MFLIRGAWRFCDQSVRTATPPFAFFTPVPKHRGKKYRPFFIDKDKKGSYSKYWYKNRAGGSYGNH